MFMSHEVFGYTLSTSEAYVCLMDFHRQLLALENVGLEVNQQQELFEVAVLPWRDLKSCRVERAASVDSQARRARRQYPPTYEVYGLQEDSLTDWLSGDVVLRGWGGEAEELVRMPGLTYGASEGFRNREGSYGGNSAAPMFGLVRDVAEGIRPSFMSQAGFPGFAVDFERRALTLGRLPDRGAEAGQRTLELVDLRPWGAPAREYACRVERLVVSGTARGRRRRMGLPAAATDNDGDAPGEGERVRRRRRPSDLRHL